MLRLRRRENHLQYEFLPAALEISESPPSPLGRIVIWIIFTIITVAIIWACFGKIDEVAVARGKVVPDGRLKVVQSLEEGIITAIDVSEGQRVKEGQLLVELDSTMKVVDVESLQLAIDTAGIERELLKEALEGKNVHSITSKVNLPDEIETNLLMLAQARDSEYETKKNLLELLVQQSEEQLLISQSDLQKLEESILIIKDKEKTLKKLMESGGIEASNLDKVEKSIEILKEQEENYKKLYESGATAKSEWLDKKNELILAQIEYESQKARVAQEKSSLELNWKNATDELTLTQEELLSQKIRVEQAENKLEEAKTNQDYAVKEREYTILNLIVETDKKIAELESQLTKASKSVQFQSIVSPVDGTVHGLVSNTIGGVVTPAQPIMTIVPDGTPLIIEASLLNKDIGFVTVGQEVAVKFDTFPFQKYGTIKGKVESISPDAFEDEGMGSVYKMKVSLEKSEIMVNGKAVGISPGMAATAEIKTGKKRIIEFFLEPLIKYADESLKIR